MDIEKYTFKSHTELYDFCKLLIKNKEQVCQTIKDFADFGIDVIANFKLETDYIYHETDETSDSYGMWKVKRKNYFE